jgi:hypothetical protein
MSVSHEVFASAMDASINRISSLEKGFEELKESVFEMAKRQHIIAAALLTLADKLDIEVEVDDEL